MSSARYIARNPSTWPDIPSFLAVWSGAWGFSVLRTAGLGERWSRATSSPIRASRPSGTIAHAPTGIDLAQVTHNSVARCRSERTVHAIVVTFNSIEVVPTCIDRLLASEGITALRITVIDNASSDGGASALVSRFPQIDVIVNQTNVGFAAAVNKAAAGSTSRWLAIINPDVEVRPDTLASCVEYLENHPDVGSCGVRAVLADGSVNDRSFFVRPTIWSEVMLAIGAHRIAPASRLFNPEQCLAYQAPTGQALGVDVVAGCFNVLDWELFEYLGGYDEGYFLCGEDFDLGLRALEAGAAPAVVPARPILHHSARSFGSRPDARVAYLRGRAQFQSRWWPRHRAVVGGVVRSAAILGRLAVLPALSPVRHKELVQVWARRDEWTAPDGSLPSISPSGGSTSR